jgi:anti-sigma B factor antagonist
MQDNAPAESPRVPARDASDDGVDEIHGSKDLRIDVRRDDQATFVDLSGELDLSSAPRLRELLVTMLSDDAPPRIVVDLTDLVYLDSTGLSVFVAAHKRASSADTEFSLANPNPSVRRLLGITALDQIFDIDDVAEPASPTLPLDAAQEGEGAIERDA